MALERLNATGILGLDVCEQTRALILIEAGRLRCERLSASLPATGVAPDRGATVRAHLGAIHRELGMAGYVLSDPLSVGLRRRCTRLARDLIADEARPRSDVAPTDIAPGVPPTGPAATANGGAVLARTFSDAIEASDALARAFGEGGLDEVTQDRLHLGHAHVMAACERLDEALTALEAAAEGLPAPSNERIR
jgi:hypothetical protein